MNSKGMRLQQKKKKRLLSHNAGEGSRVCIEVTKKEKEALCAAMAHGEVQRDEDSKTPVEEGE